MAGSRKSTSSNGDAERPREDLVAKVASELGRALFPGANLLIGLSGGVDSMSLATILARLAGRMRFSLRAVHVNHGISPNAPEWARFCASFCERSGIRLSVEEVDVTRWRHLGREGAARAARYEAFARHRADFLVLAQHRDDQVETLLLQLLRAAGPAGLAGMQAWSRNGLADSFPHGILRPLLGVARADIETFAKANALQWIEDESNEDTSLERNFIRHALLPILDQRYPHARAAIARSASHLAEAAAILADVGREDRKSVMDGDGLDIARLRALGHARAKNVLRVHCREAGCPAPGGALLEELWLQITGAGADAAPRIELDGWIFRRYRSRLYLDRQTAPPPRDFEMEWKGENSVPLPELGGMLRFKPEEGRGLSVEKLRQAPVTLRLRQGGERLRPHAAGPRRTLKNLFQERGVPPWRRDTLPFVYCGEVLVAVPGIGEDADWRARPGERGLIATWEPM